jgi:ribosomal protein L36
MNFCGQGEITIDFGTLLIDNDNAHSSAFRFILGNTDRGIVKLELLDRLEMGLDLGGGHGVAVGAARSRKVEMVRLLREGSPGGKPMKKWECQMCKREGKFAVICDYRKDANEMFRIRANKIASNMSSSVAERVVLGHSYPTR